MTQNPRLADDEYILIDLNQDGLADLVRSRKGRADVFINDKGVLPSDASCSVTTGQTVKGASLELLPSNVCEYNRMSHFITINDADIICYNYSKIYAEENLLTRLTDSYGNSHVSDYLQLTSSNNGCYQSSNVSYGYPYSSVLAPLYLLGRDAMYDNKSSLCKEVAYNYAGAVANREGLGFICFEKIGTRDLVAKHETVECHDPLKFGALVSVSSDEVYTSTSYYCNVEAYGKVHLVPTYSSEMNLLTGTSTSNSYSYNNFDNPTFTVTSYGSDKSIKKRYTYNNVVNDNTYLLGLPVKVVTESLRSRDSKLMTSETTEYDAMYQPLRKVSSVGANKLNETHWTYDVYGNVTSETSAPYDVTTFVGKSYEYGSDGRFVVASTDALGLKTSYAGFDKNGNAGTVTDVRGLTTNFAYDVWGRLTDVAHPDGTIEESVLVWGGEGLYTMLKKQTGKPTTIVHYDSQQREIRSCKQRFDDKWQMVDKVYDERGRLSKVSLPFIGSAPSYWNVYTYDEHDRPVSYDEASGKRTHWSYGKLNTTETKDGMTTTRTVDATGTVVKVEDAGGTIVYNLRSDDQLASIVAPGDVETTFTYDEYGRKTSMNDPSFGLQTMSESWSQDGTHSQTVTDADGRVVTTNYDAYGRKVSEVRPEFTTNFAYDEYGNLSSEKSSHGIYREYAYNQYGQLEEQSTRVLRNKKEVQTFKYENGNLVAKMIGLCFNNSDKVVSRRNNVEELYKYSNGSLVQILLKNLNVNNNVWQLLDENEFGQPTKVLTGSMQRVYAYDEYGTPKERRSGDIMHESYQFDNTTGNLLKRTDVMRNLTETFGYDDLNRLVRVNDKTVGYAANGNILNRTGVGSFEYDDADKPYAVTGLVRGEANACTQRQSVAYNSLMRPQSIENDSVKTTFLYDVNGDRVIVAKGSEKNYYFGEYEVMNNAAKQIVYLGGDAYTAPMAYVGLGSGFSWGLVNICRDYLGSITHIASYSGNSLYEYSYDVWGNMRNPDTWEVYPVDEQPELYLGRGYTGHEHLREYGLINMNARLYDPEIGRFISPDPYVQQPDCSQNFNRYSYCLNNPMKYTDENGEFFLLTGIIAIGNTISNVFRHGLNFSQYTWNATVNSFKLDLGMFKGNVFQVLNKWTWGFVNSVVGYTVAQTLNVLGQIKYITDLDGMLAISGPMYSNKGKAFTIAHYSFGPRHYKADWRDHLFVHEYGHYMQAQRMGIGFVYIVGIPSLLSAAQITTGDMTHSERWFEVDASTLGAKHFDKHYGRGAKGYIRNDENYFDIYSFWNSATTPYTNPRTGDNEQKVQVSGKSKFIIWDLFF